MQYFKHVDIIQRYRVSLKTIHNWIDAAKRDKLDLELYSNGKRTYIVNNSKNIAILNLLAERGKKYRNTLSHKTVTPLPTFYELYTNRQILDIISNLTIHHEIPRQYNYIGEGGRRWNNFLIQQANKSTSNIITGTFELIHTNMDSIDQLLEGYKKINVIDLGSGNARPAKELLSHLLKNNILHRYIAIDISASLLEIAKRNIEVWFGDKINFEGYVRDLTYERFDDLLVEDMLREDSHQTINLVLLLGGTAKNLRSFSDIFRVIYGSIGPNGLLVYDDKLDTEITKRYFESYSMLDLDAGLLPHHSFILEQMGVDKSLYKAEAGFDEKALMRYIRIRFKTALTIRFQNNTMQKDVSFEKEDTILLLRFLYLSALEVIAEFEQLGFRLLQSSTTRDRRYFLSISEVDLK